MAAGPHAHGWRDLTFNTVAEQLPSLYRHRKDLEQTEQYGKRFAYPSAYKPEIKARHRIMLPGLGEVVIQGTVEARLRDLFPGRNGLA